MLLKHLLDVGHEQLSEKMSYEELLAFNERAWDLSLSWDFFDWLRSITKLPLLVKGILRREDALKAVSIGLDGIIVHCLPGFLTQILGIGPASTG